MKQRIAQFRRRLRADAQKGSAAIEFAFVAPVFFVLLLGIFEAAVMFFSQAALQNAVNDTSRLVRTGQAQTGAMTKAQFRTKICDAVAPLIPCDGNLQIDVQAYPSYGNVSYPSPLNGNGTLNTALNNYITGSACDVVLVRAFYTWTVYTPVLTWFLVNMAGNKHMLSSAAAFRNEPYNTGADGC